MVFNRFERFTSFKPPAMPVVYDLGNSPKMIDCLVTSHECP